MDKELKAFTENIDAWIKQIRKEFAEFKGLPEMVLTNANNINENLDTICDLREKVTELGQEINALKMIQIISLRKENYKKVKDKPDAKLH